ncbi:CpaF family protein [Paenibacillus sp. SYP-B4298]|uniref:CpaF family protein n=1 Tax=Paenibacillus sp. SYP-B4298 TaxID=2996034 RepID=UPI0022DE8A18|nr:CpaF family protein [Paenibacillus sp. SYP-B4298]
MLERAAHSLRERVRQQIDLGGSVSDQSLMSIIERTVFDWCKEQAQPLTSSEQVALVRRLFHSFRGMDVLQPLMDDPTVTEIMINAHDEIFIEQHGRMSRCPVSFESRQRLEDIIQTIVAGVNRVVNESTPIVDARLPDGSRVHVVLPPIALKGPTLTIRKFPAKPLLMADLIAVGALNERTASMLERLVAAKYNLFISGGTGSGKTTFLNALSQAIPPDERLITIEDSAELQITRIANLVSLETRNANTEGRGEIPIRELIRASLRMRPSRIIVGEVRGGEALDMLQAMNTGHEGSLSTGHANGARDMISRLETMVLAAAELPLPVIRQQIASALDIIVHLSRLRDGSRKVVEISEVLDVREGEVQLSPLYRFEEEGEQQGKVTGGLVWTGNRLQQNDKLAAAGMDVDKEEWAS